MGTTVILGAPSLLGEDARDTLSETLSGMVFPATVTIANRMPFHLVFPYAGVYLQASGHTKSEVEAQFSDKAALARFVTDAQAVGDLNNAREVLALTLPTAKGAAGESRKTAKAPANDLKSE